MITLTNSQKVFLGILCLGMALVVVGTVWWVITKSGESDVKNAFLAGGATAEQYTDVNGAVVNISDQISGVTVVTVWASWSPYSAVELPMIDALAAEYKDRGVTFVALNRKEPKEQAQRFLATLPPLTHTKVIIDTADTFYAAVGGYAMPETMVYNKDGEVIDHIRVVLTEDIARSALDKALENN